MRYIGRIRCFLGIHKYSKWRNHTATYKQVRHCVDCGVKKVHIILGEN